MARVFDLIENPEKGWTTRKIKQVTHLAAPTEWLVQLVRESDGATIEFRHEQLHIAWCRAVERAHSTNIGLDHDDEEPSVAD